MSAIPYPGAATLISVAMQQQSAKKGSIRRNPLRLKSDLPELKITRLMKIRTRCQTSVSYTHLDVYKRQPLYHQVAEMVFAGYRQGNLSPAGILNHFINDEEQYKEVAGLFNASLKESLNNDEQRKAFSETVYRVKKNSLDIASRKAADIGQLQQIIREQAALKTLQITID